MKERTVIAGIGATAFGNLPGRSTISLNVEAIRTALADAGLEKDEIDALFVKAPTSTTEKMYAHKLAEAIALQPAICGVWDAAGAGNIAMIRMADLAIRAGDCEVAVVCFADNPRSGSRASYERERGGGGVFGWYGVPPAYAMLARRHMGDYGTRAEDLGAVAVAARRHGAANPAAQLRKPLTLDEYMASELVVSPFRRHDCALISDGGAAVVLMSERHAKARGVRRPVPVLGLGQSHGAWDVSLRPDLSTSSAAASGEQAFRMAGLTPADIDVAQIYDCFTITALITLEDYGFCKKGQGGSFVRDGAIEIGGRLPMNTAGGLLSETGMPGMQLVLEGVRQMRGEAVSQVTGARTCIVSNQGGIMQSHATMILGQAT